MLVPVALALPLLAAAPAFDDAKAKATPVESLKKTVSALVGDCSGADFETAIECQENLQAEAKKLRKGTYSVYFGPGNESLVRYEGLKGGKPRLILTPMFDAGGGHALTVGKPTRLDKGSGTPVVKVLVLDGEFADGVMESDLNRALRLGMVGVEMVGRFDASWSLNAKDKVVQGVTFKPTAIRFTNARSGKAIVDVKVR